MSLTVYFADPGPVLRCRAGVTAVSPDVNIKLLFKPPLPAGKGETNGKK